MKKKILPKSKEMTAHHIHKKDLWLIIVVIIISIFLNGLGFGWGKDGYVPWSPDSIEGVTTVRELPNLFGTWTNKYPRLQFLIDGLCYKPVVRSWEREPVAVQRGGRVEQSVLTQEQLEVLATISRINILIMSAGILIFVYLIARFYYADSIAAFFASLSIAVTLNFVYYSHTTCVDIPSMFWITLGVYFLLKSVYSGSLFYPVMMGIALACACCTKDPMLFYAAAFALAYIVLRFYHFRQQGLGFKACLLSLLNRNTWLAMGAFLFVFALLQGILFSPKAYWERMGVWVGGRGVKDFNQGFGGQWILLTGTLGSFYWSIGWPLLMLWLFSMVLTFKKHRLLNTVIVILPLVIFYVLVSMRIHMSYIRYYLPVMGVFFLPVGAYIAQLFSVKVTWVRRPALALIALCYVLSLMNCLAMDMELINDSRNQAAEWFKTNVKQNTPVLSLIRYPFGLKLSKFGYPTIDNWKVPPLQVLLDNQKNLPEYIVISNNWLTISTPDAAAFKESLLEGRAGFTKTAEFGSKGYMYPRRNWLSIAVWPMPSRFEEISPEIIVMKKKPAK
ncbi:MAG: glycosyltransferase family 39 protein [Planctomycetes bacterium]|nr:glycosyltransferase family 39 protein [Planctomycetota bacterium]